MHCGKVGRLKSSTTAKIQHREGNGDCIKQLLKAGADPNLCDKGGRTPLYWTSFHHHVHCARILKEGGAEDLVRLFRTFRSSSGIFNQESQRGQTALAVATKKDHNDIVEILK